MINLLALVHLAAVSVAAGVMWSVELFAYPLFAHVGAAAFTPYHAEHCRRITLLVGVVLGTECLSGAALLIQTASRVQGISLLLTAAGLVVTGLAAVPAHEALGRGFDTQVHRRLTRVHHVRTAIWTLHVMLLVFFGRADAWPP